MNNNLVIIFISLLIILSFFFNVLSKKTQIPSVVLLIGAGFGVRISPWFNQLEGVVDIFLTLNILGVIGLIMIVLDASVDLKLSRDRLPLILKALGVSLLLLIITSAVVGFIIHRSAGIDFKDALLYALPLSVMSSAIIIPSIEKLAPGTKEFMIYESTFSDILGIILFYMLLDWFKLDSLSEVLIQTTWKLSLTFIVSVGITLAMTYLFQRWINQINYFLIFAILLLMYAIGKEFHLSALILILVFGVMINNKAIFFRGIFNRIVDDKTYESLLQNMKLFIRETSFLIRTFFFFFFGLSISPEAFLNPGTHYVAAIILLSLYIIRYFSLKLVVGTRIFPELFIAARGLITILLLFSIPENLIVDQFEEDLTSLVIIGTNLIMMLALMSKNNPVKNLIKSPTENTSSEIAKPEKASTAHVNSPGENIN